MRVLVSRTTYEYFMREFCSRLGRADSSPSSCDMEGPSKIAKRAMSRAAGQNRLLIDSRKGRSERPAKYCRERRSVHDFSVVPLILVLTPLTYSTCLAFLSVAGSMTLKRLSQRSVSRQRRVRKSTGPKRTPRLFPQRPRTLLRGRYL